MNKQRKWQLGCIIAVVLLTFYNIAPTLFYYARPLQEPVQKEQSVSIAQDIAARVNVLEKESVSWVKSFCKLLSLTPDRVLLNPESPQWISVEFNTEKEAQKFRKFFPQAARSISFLPNQLYLHPTEKDQKLVLIGRHIPYHLSETADLFSLIEKGDLLDQKILLDKATQIVAAINPKSPSKTVLEALFRQEGKVSLPLSDSPIQEIAMDTEKECFILKINPQASSTFVQNALGKLRFLKEKVDLSQEEVLIPFYTLPQRSSSLALDMQKLAKKEIQGIVSSLKASWHPTHPDLQSLALVDKDTYDGLALEDKGTCLIAFSPLAFHAEKFDNASSIYLAIKGLERIHQSYIEQPNTPLAQAFQKDIQNLYALLAHFGFRALPLEEASSFLASDIVLEKAHFAIPFLAATREEFSLTPDGRYALLHFSNLEHRILTENKIDTDLHQELISWEEEYLAAQVSLDPIQRYTTPKPTHHVIWNNLLLSFKKILRGDEKKILRWGLDLSGGKTVEIELLDEKKAVVQSDAEIQQGMRELYRRVNKMGLSEVAMRQVGHHIVLDFPGSQSLSASELIQASSMYFYVLNEKFSSQNPVLGEAVDRFLQGIWDEAVLLNKTDIESIQEIGRQHLSSQEGKLLQAQGLSFFDPHAPVEDKVLSRILLQKGDTPMEWNAYHPLMIAFYEHALEGAQLENIQSSYEPSRGNYLSFAVASAYQTRDGTKTNPQESLEKWSSQYAKENIVGTPNETYSRGRGWRMAVVLNDTVISSPSLESTLKTNATITGHFSMSEIQKLTADLKAGSMTFTPHILSEKNVSPELGKSDRIQGITATIAALILVIGSMLLYYRFAGLVASVAVVFNLLILWAVLQNLGAALSLASIAGIILTVGMSIDANVLVFERIKEELALGKSISSAINVGYKKAFSAILDSNVTTIIAALILLNFDAGPMKSFAMNLIIGIIASMFTALFMTRVYFTRWAEKQKNKTLKMAHWIQETSFRFLQKSRLAFGLAISIITIGLGAIAMNSSSILGLDFTGGFSLHVELVKTEKDESYAQKVATSFVKHGAKTQDFQIQEMGKPNELRILLSQNMELAGKPFYGLPLENKEGKAPYEQNPRIVWVVQALQAEGLVCTENSLASMPANWSSVSSQTSDAMQSQALFGFLLSLLAIFIYLAFRFEYPFAIGAVVCLLHDLFITVAFVGILHALKVPIQIDLITIAALMTAIGYSLNDTIIIFDRIREEIVLSPKTPLKELVDRSLNATLSRTVITSGTTLFVLVALLVLGSSSIFGFACVMTIGVVFGTLSSWFIAAPLMLFFHAREEKKWQREALPTND